MDGNDDDFTTVNAKPSVNPLLELRDLSQKWQDENPQDRKFEHLNKFLNFAIQDLSKGSLISLKLPNSGETKMVAGTILIKIGTSKELEDKLVPELYNNLYVDTTVPMEKVKFNYTQIPGILEWWEKGEVTEEAFGTVHNDKLVGFVRFGV